MSRNDEPLTRAGIWQAADLTYQQHQPRNQWTGTCAQCTPNGCLQLAWALSVRAGGAAAYPVAQPKALSLAAARPPEPTSR